MGVSISELVLHEETGVIAVSQEVGFAAVSEELVTKVERQVGAK